MGYLDSSDAPAKRSSRPAPSRSKPVDDFDAIEDDDDDWEIRIAESEEDEVEVLDGPPVAAAPLTAGRTQEERCRAELIQLRRQVSLLC